MKILKYCIILLDYSSANAKKWEIELQTLKNNNLRLTSALQESTANVDEWKRQLQSYKDENQRLKSKYIDLETSKGNHMITLKQSFRSLGPVKLFYFSAFFF